MHGVSPLVCMFLSLWLLLSVAASAATDSKCEKLPLAQDFSDPKFNSTFLSSKGGEYDTLEISLMVADFQEKFFEEKLNDFCLVTGCIPTLCRTTAADRFRDVMQDITTTNLVDGYIAMSVNVPQFAQSGGLDILTERVQTQLVMDWFGIYPAVRETSAVYNKQVYTVPLDGDVIMGMYREDLLQEIPKTIAELVSVSEFFHGKDLNSDGEPDYGICIASKKDNIADDIFWAVIAPFQQTQGTSEGIFFDPNSMQPKMTSDAFKTGMELHKQLVLASPFVDEGPTDWQKNNQHFLDGRCALYLNYPGPVKMVIGRQQEYQMSGKFGIFKLPGITCKNSADCPHAIEGISYAPFYAGGGASGIIRASAEETNKRAIFDFFTFLSDPEICYRVVADPGTFLDPFRSSHIKGLDDQSATSPQARAFQDQGWERRQLPQLHGFVKFAFSHRNAALDLRIPGSYEYKEEKTMLLLVDYWNGSKDQDRVIADLIKGWNEVTEKFGLDKQQQIYRAGLGLNEYVKDKGTSGDSGGWAWWLIAIIAILTFAVALGIIVGISFSLYRLTKFLRSAREAQEERRRRYRKLAYENWKSLEELVCTMSLIRSTDFVQAGEFLAFERARDLSKHRNLDTFEEAQIFCNANDVIFFSHQWLSISVPDPQGVHFRAACDALAKLIQQKGLDTNNTFIWIDYTSIPQRNKSLQQIAISALPVFASLPRYFICLVPETQHEHGYACGPESYLDRGWCRLEQWARMSMGGLPGIFIYKDSLNSVQSSGFTHDWLDKAIRVLQGKFSVPDDKHKLTGVVLALWMYALLVPEEDDMVYKIVSQNKRAVFPSEDLPDDAIVIAEQVCEEIRSDPQKYQEVVARRSSSMQPNSSRLGQSEPVHPLQPVQPVQQESPPTRIQTSL